MSRPALLCALVAATLAIGGVGCKGRRTSGATGAVLSSVHLGFFPNLTHGPALVGLLRGDFARALAPLTVEAQPFNAGPQAMEALFAGAIDACYVGSGAGHQRLSALARRGAGHRLRRGAQRRRAGRAPRRGHPRPGRSARQEDRVAAARQHAGHRAAHLPGGQPPPAQGSRRRRADPAAGQRRHPDPHEAGAARRRVGARAVDDAPHRRGGRHPAGRRAGALARQQVPDHGAGGDQEAGERASRCRRQAGGGKRGDHRVDEGAIPPRRARWSTPACRSGRKRRSRPSCWPGRTPTSSHRPSCSTPRSKSSSPMGARSAFCPRATSAA